MKQLTPQNIWNMAQNKPSQVAADLRVLAGVPTTVTYYVLLRRGVFKWLANRRFLIKLKDSWRAQETLIQRELYQTRKLPRCINKPRAYWKGYLQALKDCRAQVRRICHSDRWQAPDNDRNAQIFLVQLMAYNYMREQRKKKGDQNNENHVSS